MDEDRKRESFVVVEPMHMRDELGRELVRVTFEGFAVEKGDMVHIEVPAMKKKVIVNKALDLIDISDN